MVEKKKKKKLRIKGLILILLIVYIIITSIMYFINIPIKKINIEGNYYLKDNYLIDYLNIKDQSIFKLNSKSIKDKLLKLDLISAVKIKKNYLGILTISLTEDKILFYNLNKDKLILTSGREIENNSSYLGVPTLINYVPDDIYAELLKKMLKIDYEMLTKISEIEYNPSKVNDKIIDGKRFLFRMNDGNKVYINTVNMEKINDYLEIYELIVNKNGLVKGCLYLDSNSDNKTFNDCHEEIIDSNIVSEDKNA